MSLIDPRLLAILRCPVCHGDLTEGDDVLACAEGHEYRVVDGIPDMVPEGEVP